MFGMFFLGSLYLRGSCGYDPLQIGLAFLPVAVVHGRPCRSATPTGWSLRFGARADHADRPGPDRGRAGAVRGRPGRRRPTCRTSSRSMVLIGAGAGLCFPALMTLAMSGATAEDAGPGLRAGQHHRRRSAARSGLAVLATVSASPDQRPGRPAPARRGRADRRLPPGLLDRLRPGRRGRWGHPGRAAPAAGRETAVPVAETAVPGAEAVPSGSSTTRWTNFWAR